MRKIILAVLLNNISKLKDCRKEVIMLIDDDEIDLYITQKVLMLSNVGRKFLNYPSAHQAIDYLNNCENQFLPDLIFLDINMPKLSGYGFLSQFNDLNEEVKHNCNIVILTSSTHSKDLMMMEQNEFVSAYLNKPLVQAEVKALFE